MSRVGYRLEEEGFLNTRIGRYWAPSNDLEATQLICFPDALWQEYSTNVGPTPNCSDPKPCLTTWCLQTISTPLLFIGLAGLTLAAYGSGQLRQHMHVDSFAYLVSVHTCTDIQAKLPTLNQM